MRKDKKLYLILRKFLNSLQTMKLRKILALLLLLISVNAANAQYENFEDNNSRRPAQSRSDWFWEHIVFGGNIGFSLGTNVTAIEVNPCIGYRFNRYVNAGMIFTYEYYKNSYYDYDNSIFGGGVYAECYPIECLTIHAEAQYLNFKDYYNCGYGNDVSRTWDMPVLVGAGYRKMLSDVVSINIMLLFNINNTSALSNNVYGSNPIVRMNILF
jgi:hypothetical protein